MLQKPASTSSLSIALKVLDGLPSKKGNIFLHTGEFPKGVGHRVENGWGLTKVAVVLLNGVLW